jgi:hypothetical protein
LKNQFYRRLDQVEPILLADYVEGVRRRGLEKRSSSERLCDFYGLLAVVKQVRTPQGKWDQPADRTRRPAVPEPQATVRSTAAGNPGSLRTP